MAKLFVICGHGGGDPGACSNGYTEEERVRALAARIKALGGDNVTVGDTSKNWYKTAAINSLTISKDYKLIELHMDSSSSSSARGAHVIIKSGYDADSYDNSLASSICSILPGRSSKIVGRSDLANVNRAANKGYNYRLLECGFISNSTDVSIFNSKTDEIATAILSAFGITASSSNSSSSSSSTSSGSSTSSSSSSSSGTNTIPSTVPFTVNVLISNLNIRASASSSATVKGQTGKGTFTITQVSGNWGKLKSGAGWIYLKNSSHCTIGSTTTSSTSSSSSNSYKVSVTTTNLNIRTGPGTNYSKTGKKTGKGTFTITQTSSGQGSDKGWGKLKSGAGWISLDYVTKL